MGWFVSTAKVFRSTPNAELAKGIQGGIGEVTTSVGMVQEAKRNHSIEQRIGQGVDTLLDALVPALRLVQGDLKRTDSLIRVYEVGLGNGAAIDSLLRQIDESIRRIHVE